MDFFITYKIPQQ